MYWADLALGVEHVDVYAFNAEESVGHGTACVARGGNEDIDLFVSSLTTDEVLEQTCHEACADVFEGECGTVKEFERIDIVLDLDCGYVKAEGVVDYLAQALGFNVFAEEAVCYVVGYLLQAEVLDVVKKILWEGLYFLGHIKSLVLCKSVDHGLLQCGKGCLAVSAVIFHCVVVLF